MDFRGLWNSKKPVVGNMRQIKSAILKAKRDGVKILRLGGMTDCFQPLNKKIKRVSRLVILPDYQGIGLGTKF